MVLIADSRGRRENSGYTRIFGDRLLGHLLSRVQATVIRAGTELEKMVLERVDVIEDLDKFLLAEIMADGVQVATKREMKRCETLDFGGSEPDLLVFKRRNASQACHVVELKDGDNFDTKKSSGERSAVHGFISRTARDIPYVMHPHFACFNQNDRQAIYDGFKRKVVLEECMTGREFCDLLEINYDEIVGARRADQPANLAYFVDELLAIPAIRSRLRG